MRELPAELRVEARLVLGVSLPDEPHQITVLRPDLAGDPLTRACPAIGGL
ncbi:hypothetical protein ABZ917_06850 [Nonomuraea wenchangensis]